MRLCCTALLVLLALIGVAQHGEDEDWEHHHSFFNSHSFSFGLGSAYSFHAEALGINSRIYYNPTKEICFGPELSYVEKGSASILDLNFIGHYVIETPLFGVYPLTGGNYTRETHEGASEDAFGIALGGGMHRNFKAWTIFVEYSHIFSQLKDDFISVGVFYTIK